MVTFRNISFKNKILISTLLVILLLGVGVTLTSRWILLPTLTSQLKQRGLGIAQSIAESSRGYILTENIADLTSLIFDAAQLQERRPLINYIFISDKEYNILSHTFTSPFAEELRTANIIRPEQSHKIKLLKVRGESAYDIAVPILEGIYHIGTVHVGLSKKHIDRLISKLATTFWGIISAIIIIGFFISHILSKYITRPVSQLTEVADEISRGNLEIRSSLGSDIRCWEIEDCEQKDCPAYQNTELPCWYIDGTLCAVHPYGNFPEKLEFCKDCVVYAKRVGDEIVQLADSFTNMTCRLTASETELRESEEKYLVLFYYHPNCIFVLDAETFKISDANVRAMEIYGYKKKELIGKSFMDLGPAQYDKGILSRGAKKLIGRDQPFSYEEVVSITGPEYVRNLHHGDMALRAYEKLKKKVARPEEEQRQTPFSVYPKILHRKKDGKPFYVNIYACRTGHTPKYGIIASTIDITESLAKESQLIQASKMTTLGEMAAGVAHELNQPLSAIQIGSDFISNMVDQRQEIPQSHLAVVCNLMAEQVARAVRIINHLREFGRKTQIKSEKVHINDPIEGVFTLLSQQLKVRGIKVVLDLKKALPPIMGDSNRLEQVFIDLVVNARDAMEEKKEKFAGRDIENILTIKSFQENGQVVVTIADTGIGMPDDIRDKIFEPFFTTKDVDKGTGLGLSISYGIVKDCGGNIQVESEAGKGTTLRVSFPACDGG